MRPTRSQLARIALAAFTVSWFLPVHRAGAKIGTGELPGWQAFRLSLSRLWELTGARLADEPLAFLPPLSALTNFWFLVAAFLLLRRPAGPRPVLKWGLLVSLALNLFWFAFGADRGDLRAGYYLWVASFAILAVAALDRSPAGGPKGHAGEAGG
jgi:hypothetical protein